MADFKVLSQYFLGGIEENKENLRIASVQAQIEP